MCIFHKWEEINSLIGTTNAFYPLSNETIYGVKVKLSIEKCTKCGKERAFLIDSNNKKQKLAVWLAKDHLGIK